MTKTPFSSRILSALAVVGPLAPSQMIFALMLAGVLAGDDVLEGGRDQHVAVDGEQLARW